MKKSTKLGIGLIIAGLVIGLMTPILLFSEDQVNYHDARSFTKSREVADQISYIELTVLHTASTTVNLPRTSSRIIVKNTDANDLYVNFSGASGVDLNLSDGTTTLAGNTLVSTATNFETSGVQVGDLVTFDEGDANDGAYYVVAVDGKTITLNTTTALAVAGTEDFIIRSPKVSASTTETFMIGTKQIGLLSNTGSSAVEIEVYFQRGS